MLTLREILDRASSVFRERYKVDGRLLESKYFINGDWDQETFDKTLKLIATAEPLSKRIYRLFAGETYRAEIEAHFDKRLSGAWPEELAYKHPSGGGEIAFRLEDFRNGKSVSLAELSQGNEGLRSRLLLSGLIEDQSLSLSLGVALRVSTGGLRRHGHGLGVSALIGSTTLVVNQTGIAIW